MDLEMVAERGWSGGGEVEMVGGIEEAPIS